jgi:hypothetical protein
MHLKPDQSLLAALLLTVLVSAGCSARRPIATTGPPFRLASLDGEPVLFPPSIPESHPNTVAITIEMNLPSLGASQRADCLAEKGPFRVEIAKNHPDSVLITLPSTERWIGDLNGLVGPDGDSLAALYVVLAELDQPQQAACFDDADSTIRNFILQSLPMGPPGSLFNYYGYRPNRSGLDLNAGMRLKIERAYLRPAKAGEEAQTPQDPAGVSFVYFDVEAASNSKIQFRRFSDVRFTPASLKSQFQSEGQEAELLGSPPESKYRLVFYTLLVSKEQKLSAAIIGASSASQLDEFDHELRQRPEGGCKNFASTPGVACVEFNGWVTVTCQIRVELNGKSKLIDWGTHVRDLVPKDYLSSLTIQRKFVNSYRNIHFDPADASILSLALVGGDRLRWSKTAPVGR